MRRGRSEERQQRSVTAASSEVRQQPDPPPLAAAELLCSARHLLESSRVHAAHAALPPVGAIQQACL